ncbi:FERM domain-containing protein 8 [Amia ocellicauda]|uniref:FERM domain-containing protein 8 n=1 Tax=Amia ocellicauda TaxID=2972642 RepID=UPI003464011B
MESGDPVFPVESSEPSQRGSVSSSGARALEVLVYVPGGSAVQLCVEGLCSVSVQELSRSVRQALQLPDSAQDAFALWLCSPLLELQLKPRHQPYRLSRQWQDLLYRFTDAPEDDIAQDEPCLQYRRNVFFPRAKELQLEEEGALRLLFEEARSRVLSGSYPCDPPDWQRLGGLSCRLELGPCPDQSTAAGLLREKKLSSFLPAHVCSGVGGLWGVLRGRGLKQELEKGLLEAYQEASTQFPNTDPDQGDSALLREYLRTCQQLPYYGSAFFSGEIDKPAGGILPRGGRKAVSVAISLEGVYVMDVKEKFVLLGLRYHELSWDHTYPEDEDDAHILWLEFDGEEGGTPVNKLLKVYSKQAELMSGLIEFCVELGGAEGGATEVDGVEVAAAVEAAAGEQGAQSQQAVGQPGEARGGRRGKLRRQNSVVSSRVQSLRTINYYVDDGRDIKRLKPKRAASFFTRQVPTSPTSYTAVQVIESLEQG